MLSGFCPASFGVLFGSVVLGCRHIPKLLNLVVSGASFLIEGVFSVTFIIVDLWQYCECCVRSSITDASSLWCSIPVLFVPVWVICHSGGISVYLRSSSLQNFAVPQEFYSPISISVNRSWWPCIRRCGCFGFQEHGQYLFFLTSCSSLSPTVFPFSTFILCFGIVGLGSLDWQGAYSSLPD